MKQPTTLNPITTNSNKPKTAEKETKKREKKNQIQIEEGRDRESWERNREEWKKKSNIEWRRERRRKRDGQKFDRKEGELEKWKVRGCVGEVKEEDFFC